MRDALKSNGSNTGAGTPEIRCGLCGSRHTAPLYAARGVPVLCNNLWPDREQAVACPRGDIELIYCRECGYIWNAAFDASRLEYTGIYDNSLHFSARFQGYAGSLAQRLIERYGLHGKEIIEIGCGKGDFLVMLCTMGGNRGVGFDRSYVGRSGAGDGADVTFIKDHYSAKYANQRADLVIARHVLEHVPDPVAFLRMVREAIGVDGETALFIEVPSMLHTVRKLFVWDIIYEHYSYFIPRSLKRLLTEAGFTANEMAEEFAGQYLTAHAAPRTGDASITPSADGDAEDPDIDTFGDGCARLVGSWRSRIERLAADGKRIIVWGAGSKGVTFLNAISPGDAIRYAVDINPAKEGMHVAGTGQRIVPPSFLGEYAPDVIIVMNRVYEDEIRSSVGGMGISPGYEFV